MIWKMYLLSAMAMLGIYVKFQRLFLVIILHVVHCISISWTSRSKNCFFWDIDIIVTLIIHPYLIAMSLYTYTSYTF